MEESQPLRELVLDYVQTLVWPLVVVVLVLVFRSELVALFRRLTKLAGFGAEAHFAAAEAERLTGGLVEWAESQAEETREPDAEMAPTEAGHEAAVVTDEAGATSATDDRDSSESEEEVKDVGTRLHDALPLAVSGALASERAFLKYPHLFTLSAQEPRGALILTRSLVGEHVVDLARQSASTFPPGHSGVLFEALAPVGTHIRLLRKRGVMDGTISSVISEWLAAANKVAHSASDNDPQGTAALVGVGISILLVLDDLLSQYQKGSKAS